MRRPLFAVSLIAFAAALPRCAAWAQSSPASPAAASAPASAPARQMTVIETPLATAPAFALDWTLWVQPKSGDGGLLKNVTGHSEARRVAGTVSYRVEAQRLLGPALKPLPKPESVVEVVSGGTGTVYNAEQGLFVRSAAPAGSDFPRVSNPWTLGLDAAVGLAMGRLQNGAISRTEEETIDGTPAKVYVFDSGLVQIKGNGKQPDRSMQSVGRYAFARDSGLPLRYQVLFTTDGGPLREAIRLDITAAQALPSLADDRLALDLPATAKLWEDPNHPSLLAAGMAAPDFAGIGPDGKPVKLSDLRGKVVILDFWATWCVPCQKSLPHLESVYEKVKDQNVAVLAVCVWDKRDAYEKWVAAKKGTFRFPTAFDPAGRGETSIATTLYKVSGIPVQYVIDRDGKVAAALPGYTGADDHRLEAALAKLGVTLPAETKTAAK